MNTDENSVAAPAELGAARNADHATEVHAARDQSSAGCCMPQGHGSAAGHEKSDTHQRTGSEHTGGHSVDQVIVPGQRFRMGDARGDENRGDGETPVHDVLLEAFSIDATSVTNQDFARFVEETEYRTEAEVWGASAVFHLAVAAPQRDLMGATPGLPWWRGVKGADWRHPGGRRSTIEGLEDHPVVHISWNDAVAYCSWAGRSLPTEAQWEAAARGGLNGARFPWGDDLHLRQNVPSTAGVAPDTAWRVNIWQGVFPHTNTLNDGFLTTAPVRTFEPNAYGLWQMVGNVWEWCHDWWDRDYYRRSPLENPCGPEQGQVKVMRGGSYLCHDSYCNRYRNAARSSNTPDSSMGNGGFRTVGRRASDDMIDSTSASTAVAAGFEDHAGE